MKVQQILDLIDTRDMALPEFQRGYVWNREQVRGFLTSLYRGYPVGGFLVWHTDAGGAAQRGGGGQDGKVKLLLDGQQRATTLYGIVRGKPPRFFEGNAQAFTGLHFHIHDEAFEFYAPSKMKDDPDWIDVTNLLQVGVGPYIQQVTSSGAGDPATQFDRLNRIWMIKEKTIHLEDVVGSDKTIDVVVDIFNRVNSGGTKLSKGDLALARICAGWPEARQEMKKTLADWKAAGFSFSLDWLLRVMNAVGTGKVPFTAFEPLSPAEIKTAFADTKKYVGSWLDLISGRLGLDHDRVLFGKLALVVLARHQHLNGGKLPDTAAQDKLLYWFAHAGMWGRYAGSTETALAQDLDALETGGVTKLIDVLRLSRGGLEVRPEDFAANSLGARFYPTLYLLTRTLGARDFDSGVVLSKAMLGHLSTLEVHHVFPKKLLYAAGYKRAEVNTLANYCFLTKNSNLKISASQPKIYMPLVEGKLPGALASQWIPGESELHEIDNYPAFIAARRKLLADAANTFLTSLVAGDLPASETAESDTSPTEVVTEEADDRTEEVDELVGLLTSTGFAMPLRETEVAHPETGRVLSMAEALWPDGLQPGLGQPVVLELDEDDFDENAMAALGYLVFTSTDALLEYAAGLSGDEVADAAIEDEGDVPPPADEPSPTEEPNLTADFGQAMKDVYVKAKQETGYNATVYLRMLAEHGALGTARKLLASPGVSDGFVALWERGRVDLAVENVVLRPEFASLFTDDERELARDRLAEYGLHVD